MAVVQLTVNPPSRTFVTLRSRVRSPVTGVDVAVAEAVDVAVRDAVADDVAVRVASGVDVPVAVSVTDGVSDGPGVTVASSTTIVPVIPADAEDV